MLRVKGINRFRSHRRDEADPVTSFLELFGRQADESQRGVTANGLEEIVQADTSVERMNALERSNNDDDIVIAIRSSAPSRPR